MEEAKLPPLPSSDADSIQHNNYHGFYKIGSRDFWGEAEVSHQQLQDFKKCEQHFFIKERDEVTCTRCHLGWNVPAEMETREGKLFFRGEEQLAH